MSAHMGRMARTARAEPAATLTDRIRNGESLPLPLHLALWFASLGQRFGMWLRLRRAPVKVSARVISYGNITAGGVGKTPAVIERAKREIEAGNRVAVLTRGYGAAHAREPLILQPGEADAHSAVRFGDEAALIARRAPGVWIVRSANRVAGAGAAVEKGCNVVIMDDGFQAVTLERDENILLVDATNPFGNGYLLPRGVLREPLSAMRRATEIMLTRCDQTHGNLDDIERVVRRHAPDAPIRRARHRPSGLWRLCDGGEAPLSLLRENPVRAVCAIGNPEAFLNTLRELGANIAETHCLPDHASIPDALLDAAIPTIMTEKDAMRLSTVPSAEIYALAITLEICV